MDSVFVLLGSVVFLVLGYRLYGNLFEKRVIKPTDALTPAHVQEDDFDFKPAKKLMLFGHHFTSIAGAGAIVGPMVAVYYFGWLPAVLWILGGCIFIGMIHDYSSLMLSVRNKAKSISSIAENLLGRRSRYIFSLLVLLTLVLLMAEFSSLTANTFKVDPDIVIPVFSLMFLAVLMGFLVYRRNVSLWLSTVVCLTALAGSILLGHAVPIHINSQAFWLVVLFGYCFIASTLPIWIMMQPRDYLSTYFLGIGVALGFVGILCARFAFNAPAVTSTHSAKGPIWPILFILIACGAVSGFHALVASGTTSKQLDREKDGKMIGAGAMVLEGVVGIITVIVVGAGLFWKHVPAGVSSTMTFQHAYNTGWIFAFSRGWSRIVDQIPGFTRGGYATTTFAILMVNTFILTTLDSATRLGRFVVQETVPLKVLSSGKGRTASLGNSLSSLVVIVPAFLLAVTNSSSSIWPVFGTANQLIAAVALLVVSSYLIGLRRPSLYTLIPAGLMLVTTIAAFTTEIFTSWSTSKTVSLISFVLLIMSLVVLYECSMALWRQKRKMRSEEAPPAEGAA